MPDVAKQAVFVSSDQTAKLDVQSPMHEKRLNPKLQEMAAATGLLGRNTMYSFRREATAQRLEEVPDKMTDWEGRKKEECVECGKEKIMFPSWCTSSIQHPPARYTSYLMK